MTMVEINENGEVLDSNGEVICSVLELPEMMGLSEETSSQKSKPYEAGMGASEQLLKSATTFELPESKKDLEDGLWCWFSGGIHQTMSNISAPKQRQRSVDLLHASIFTSLSNRKIARSMSITDYIQLHIYGENLIANAVTYEGDRLRDATILGRNIDPGVIDAMKFNPNSPKDGGFLGAFKKKR